MMASVSQPPNPQRRQHPSNPAIILPKVFIAYPHKPTIYTQIAPPTSVSDLGSRTVSEEQGEELWRQYEESVVRHERDAEMEIRKHEEMVERFAEFLQKSSIAVAYDALVRDTGVLNLMRWCQHQIERSDYLILVISPSFCSFLNEEYPPERESLFQGNYLHNVIHSPPPTLQLVPIFLCSSKNLSLVPKALVTGSVYEVWDNYQGPFNSDLEALYCRLTKQNRYEPPVPVSVPFIIPSRKKRFGRGAGKVCEDSADRSLVSTLSQNHANLGSKAILKLSEKSSFSTNWKAVAAQLGLSDAEVERCEGRGRGDQEEMCLQMLRLCADRIGRQALTVAELATAVNRTGLSDALRDLSSVINL